MQCVSRYQGTKTRTGQFAPARNARITYNTPAPCQSRVLDHISGPATSEKSLAGKEAPYVLASSAAGWEQRSVTGPSSRGQTVGNAHKTKAGIPLELDQGSTKPADSNLRYAMQLQPCNRGGNFGRNALREVIPTDHSLLLLPQSEIFGCSIDGLFQEQIFPHFHTLAICVAWRVPSCIVLFSKTTRGIEQSSKTHNGCTAHHGSDQGQ